MIEFKRDELHKLARSSRLGVAEDHEKVIHAKLLAVINYTELLAQSSTTNRTSVQPATLDHQLPLRPDQARACQPATLLGLAPAQEEDYFVVPAIIVH